MGDAFPRCVAENSLESVNFSRRFTTAGVKNIVLYSKDFKVLSIKNDILHWGSSEWRISGRGPGYPGQKLMPVVRGGRASFLLAEGPPPAPNLILKDRNPPLFIN